MRNSPSMPEIRPETGRELVISATYAVDRLIEGVVPVTINGAVYEVTSVACDNESHEGLIDPGYTAGRVTYGAGRQTYLFGLTYDPDTVLGVKWEPGADSMQLAAPISHDDGEITVSPELMKRNVDLLRTAVKHDPSTHTVLRSLWGNDRVVKKTVLARIAKFYGS